MTMPFAAFDLHNHCEWSYDAAAPVEFYFRRARELGLRAFAVTDHHNYEAIGEILAAAERFPHVPFITGVEFTGKFVWEGRIRHWDMVALGLPLRPTGALKEVLDDCRNHLRAYESGYGDFLCSRGVPFTPELREKLQCTYKPRKYLDRLGVTRIKVALQERFLRESGLLNDANREIFDEAERFLQYADGIADFAHHRYVESRRISTAVRDAGGVTFLAHPPALFGGRDPEKIAELVRLTGVDGLECAHGAISPEETAFYRELCLRNHWLSTAGNDTHDTDDDGVARHLGEERYLAEILERGVTLWNR